MSKPITAKKEPAPTWHLATDAEEPKRPASASFVRIDRKKNGYVLEVEYRFANDDWDRDETTVHHTARAVIDAVAKALIPAPKPTRKPKPATA